MHERRECRIGEGAAEQEAGDAGIVFAAVVRVAEITLAQVAIRHAPGGQVQSVRMKLPRDLNTWRMHMHFVNAGGNWRPQGDSNPCYRRERAVS